MFDKMQRVVISGYGVNSSFGIGAEALQRGLDENISGVRYLDSLASYKGLQCLIGAAITEELDVKSIPRVYRRSMGRMAILGALAGLEAVQDSGVSQEQLTGPRTGCIMGSTMGSASELEDTFRMLLANNSLSEISGMQFFKCASHTVALNLAQLLGICGCVMSQSAACASSLQAVGLGFQLIRSGVLDMAFCGGAEELNALVVGSFDCLFAASTSYNNNPQMSPRPFDAARDGQVCGEGAGVVVLESLESALSRKAKIYGEVIGYNTCGNSNHISQPDSKSIALCIKQALADAGIGPEKIDYVNAHATGTLQGDAAEAAAIRETLGDKPAVSSLKGGLAHTLGASGVIELIASLMMMQNSIIYPTRNLENPADDCSGIRHVTGKLNLPVNCFIKNCFAFGGINAALVCKKF
jgi:3-oxoacyl-[acyl-carrier-protein] synthase II